MFLKCASMCWGTIDEINTAGLTVLGLLEKHTRKGCRGQLHAKDRQGNERAFGGINWVFAGDWLQLPAVAQKNIFRNPFLKDYLSPEERIKNMFWQLDDETMPSEKMDLHELIHQVRSKDEWHNAVLSANRLGTELW